MIVMLLSGNGDYPVENEDSVRTFEQLHVNGKVEIRFQRVVCYGNDPIVPDSTVYIVNGIRRVLKLEPLDTTLEYE